MIPTSNNELHSPFAPGPVASYAGELSARYAIALEPITAACIAVAGAAIGNSVRLDTGLGRPVGPNLFLAVAAHPKSPWHYVLDHLLTPVRSHQTTVYQAHRNQDQATLTEQIKAAERQLEQWTANNPYPNPKHLGALQSELSRLKALARPVWLLENPSPKHLLPGLERSPDGALLVFLDDAATNSLLDAAPELLRAAWNGAPFPDAFLSGQASSVLVQPALSLVCTCSHQTISRLLTDGAVTQSNLGRQFLTWSLHADEGLLTTAALEPVRHETCWAELLDRLLSLRQQRPLVCELSHGAKRALYGLINDLTDSTVQRHPFQALLETQVARIGLVLHLSGDSPGQELSENTMMQAVHLVRLLAAHRHKLVKQASAPRQQSEEEWECEIMLAKIRERGCLRPRQLFRHYKDQRREVHLPILNHLLTAGLVTLDSAGWLRPAQSEAKEGIQNNATTSRLKLLTG